MCGLCGNDCGMFLGENAETQQGFQELKQACVDPRGIVMGTSKAHRPLKLQQTPAEGIDH